MTIRLPSSGQIPQRLNAITDSWCCWRLSDEDKKIPYSALENKPTGHDEDHAGDWSSAVTALANAEKSRLSGIGFVFRKAHSLVFIDIDGCVKDRVIHPVIAELLPLFKDTYVEYSVSGTGLHIVSYGNIAKNLAPTPIPGADGAALELYSHSRYMAFTGDRAGDCTDIGFCKDGIESLLTAVGAAPRDSGSAGSDHEPSETTVEAALAYLEVFCRELESASDGRQALCTRKCFWLGRVIGGNQVLKDPRLGFQLIKDRITKAVEKSPGKKWDADRYEVIQRQMDLGRKTPAKLTSAITVLQPEELSRPDMPASVLCGQLGEWCRTRLHDFPIALAWPAMLAAASVLVEQGEGPRCNLNACLVAEPHHGKTQAQERANFLFRLNELGRLDENKYGSAEGLLEQVGDRNGSPLLWFPDELSHLLEKAQIQGASFPYILNSVFYKDRNDLTVQHRKKVKFNARLSIAGGVVEENFGDSFGAATTAGLYDRFLFGLFPTGNFEYVYRPMQGGPVVEIKPTPPGQAEMFCDFGRTITRNVRAPRIDASVWDARDTIRKEEKIDSRVLELAIRVAMICAAWDEKTVLMASDLGPAWELARYQQRVRQVLQPNTGRNFEAMAAFKILDYLKRHADGEKYIAWRDVLRGTKVAEFGPSVAERAVSTMIFAGEIDEATIRPEKGGRGKRLVRLAVP